MAPSSRAEARNLSASGIALLNLLAGQLKTLPNRLLIEGHTDAQPYSSDIGYTNWELSSDRANAARRLLQQDGVGPTQISQVRGYADQSLRIPANPLDPSNPPHLPHRRWVTAPERHASTRNRILPPRRRTRQCLAPISGAAEKMYPRTEPTAAIPVAFRPAKARNR